MKTKKAVKKVKTKPVEFSCHAPKAKAVFVAGTFNEWQADATPLVRDNAGNWQVAMELPPGTMNSNSSWMGSGAVKRVAKACTVAA